MEVKFAERLGFCAGVERAVKTAEEELAKDEPLYALGPLIHNRNVNSALAAKGLKTIKQSEPAFQGEKRKVSKLLIRSHGEPPEVFAEAKRCGIEIVDATCPFVKKIHEAASAHAERGFAVLIAGDENHPEVRGTLGWSGGRGVALRNVGELKAWVGENVAGDSAAGDFTAGDSAESDSAVGDSAADGSMSSAGILFLAQTTFNTQEFKAMSEWLMSWAAGNGADVKTMDTICPATALRQEGVLKLARKVPAMLIVGNSDSSNSRKLYEISMAANPSTFFIEGKEEIAEGLQIAKECNIIGIAAGASVSAKEVREIADALKTI
jgi:4-hydroxy-3-methylbut-2-enyl diphosphate reductase